MLCCSWLRHVITPLGYIGNLTKRRVQPSASIITNYWRRSWGLTHPGNQELRRFWTSVKMMVDTGSTENRRPVVYIMPEKEDDGGLMGGACKSEDGKLDCGYSSFRGKRASMEDFYDIKMSEVDGKMVCMFGIFDGHGGSRAAEYLKEHLFENLMKHPNFMQDTKSAICETYKQTDVDFLDAERDSYRDDGSTASTAVLVGNRLYVANVGDSRTIISKAGKAIPLSDDHKPNRSDERKRIENAGGVIMWAGTWRVGGVLAMSRAFGNRMLKQYVLAEPEIQEQEINEELELLVLASDGLWDVVPNEDAVSIAQTEEQPEAAARKLTETAFTRGSADNITCIVVRFHHDNFNSTKTPENSQEGSDHAVGERSEEVSGRVVHVLASPDASAGIVHRQGSQAGSGHVVHEHGSQARSGHVVYEQGSRAGSLFVVHEQGSQNEASRGAQKQSSQDGLDSGMHDTSSQDSSGRQDGSIQSVKEQVCPVACGQSVHQQKAEDKDYAKVGAD